MTQEGWLIEDAREYFVFRLQDGREVGTKSETKEKAKLHIEQTLSIGLLQEAA